MKNSEIKYKAINGVIWNMATNFTMQAVAFVIQIVLARIIDPMAYGTIALVTIFVAIANVFVSTGFASALIQRTEITDLDCSTSFYAGLFSSLVLYIALFLSSPAVASFYGDNILILILRIQGLAVIFGALTSVHTAIINRNMNFKILFSINITGILAQGVTGIFLAINGYGIWALVASYTANRIVTVIMTWTVSEWHPRFMFSIKSLKTLFAFSGKLLILALIDMFYSSVRSLIIGKKYDSESLAYYSRGNQIPSIVSNNIIGSTNSVLFPMLSRCQEESSLFKQAFRRTFRIISFISYPIYFGLIAVSEPLTILLLTEKWRDSIIFMQILCLVAMCNPFFVRTHVYNANGRSDISMWLSIVDKITITLVLAFYVIYGSLYTLILSQLLCNLISVAIGIFVNKRFLDYSIKEQFTDILPSFAIGFVMYLSICWINFFPEHYSIKLILQIFLGIAVYLTSAKISNLDSLQYIISILQEGFSKYIRKSYNHKKNGGKHEKKCGKA